MMVPPATPSERQRLDRYEILAELASGGMATVFLARLPGAGGFERLVAIKRLHPHLEREQEFVEMFLDEARIAARIHHPNVVPTLEIGTSERGYYLVMDYVEGPTLARLLGKAASLGERIPMRVAIKMVEDALAGLHAAHDLHDEAGRPLGLVHRDVSPQNVLIGVDGTARITDFGVARAVSRLSSTRAGQLKGKLGYMAPEQAKGEEIDRRADVFAAGVLLWELIAGKRLFRGKTETDAETLGRVLYGDIPRISTVVPDVPRALDDVAARALDRNLSRRFASCADFIDALEHAAAGQIASPREVARYVDQVCGKEIADRREAIKNLVPLAGPAEDLSTHSEVPRLLSSVSSASMAVADPGSASARPSQPIPQPTPSVQPAKAMGMGIALGVFVALLLGGGALFFARGMLAKPNASGAAAPTQSTAAPLASTAPPAATATAASTAATASAAASAPAAPAPSATVATAGVVATAAAAIPAPPPGAVPGPLPRATPKPKTDGLSTNPYR